MGKWLQKHPILSSIGAGLGITASSIAAGPLGNFVVGSLGIGSINGLRRNAEYTDEHTGFEKRVTQGNHLQAEIYQNVGPLRAQYNAELVRAKERQKKGLKKDRGLSITWLKFRLDRAEKKLALYQIQGVKSYKTKD